MKIKESSEDYLEKILMLKKDHGNVRSIDIATYMGYSKPTISVAMKKLREEEMITTDENGNIELTEKGLLIAEKTYEKHNIIAQMLIKLGVSSKTAYEDSCHIEHCLSDESFDALKKYLNREK
jgi:DtxR family Mn-dependent transcriptional regulator